ncbi:Uncharacterized protein PECH_008199 [Penicillium ucsense]|uniref:hydroxymethylglutaryl-CoA lyase n=1 Tax=Penicillium ucsense TaxID=2839758 RepID=A0A8J8W2N2_9EURO|nr:Uncharacterized protein PECM_005030 [Penicillium ucsense]KAF7734404.1 Uncharacterized protein PECH_008199 [Penicillium ucsense]
MTVPPAQVRIVEVGPRDGLQNIPDKISTSTKIELIRRLHETGLTAIELTSVVSPRAVPQLSDCRDLLGHSFVQDLLSSPRQQSPEAGLMRWPVLVPNVKGLEIAVQNGVREVAVFISATEGFSRANIKCSVEEGIARAREVTRLATKAGLAVRGYVSCIFEDPYNGPTPHHAVLHCVKSLLDAGCHEVSLGDTLGVGSPANVHSLLEYLTGHDIPITRLAGHFHDTYGQAVANVWEAYRYGVRVFDSSVAGLGGCPYAPGAKGNVATEDVVYMFQNAGISTGVDLTKLAETGEWVANELGQINSSRVGRALLCKTRMSHDKSSPTTTTTTTSTMTTTTTTSSLNDALAKFTPCTMSIPAQFSLKWTLMSSSSKPSMENNRFSTDNVSQTLPSKDPDQEKVALSSPQPQSTSSVRAWISLRNPSCSSVRM